MHAAHVVVLNPVLSKDACGGLWSLVAKLERLKERPLQFDVSFVHESLLVNLELDPALLVEVLQEIEAEALKAALRKRLDWRTKPLRAVLLVRLAQELAHYDLLAIVGAIERRVWSYRLRVLRELVLPLVE